MTRTGDMYPFLLQNNWFLGFSWKFWAVGGFRKAGVPYPSSQCGGEAVLSRG